MITNENIDKIIAVAESKGCRVLKNEPLSQYTTFKIGGAASAIIFVDTINTLSELFALCAKENVQNLVIGNGSNLLISDEGYKGIVFRLQGEFKSISMLDDNRIFCGAGASLAKLCKFALDNNLSGIEFAWGIPGTVGGAVYMNAGAYNGEMKDVVVSTAYVAPDGTVGTIESKDMDWAYRHSIYCNNKYIISGVIVELKPSSHETIRSRMDELMNRRKDKQPLEYPSAGSVFKRPVGYFAGGLIEQCGLKGKQIGGAQVSVKHAGFIINKGGATCNDVCSLVEFIQDTVEEKTGVKLECEIRKIN